MLGIVVFAGGEGVKATCQSINRRVEIHIVIIGENDVEVSIQLRRC